MERNGTQNVVAFYGSNEKNIQFSFGAHTTFAKFKADDAMILYSQKEP